jgi:tetratricopeptide (TPR) repeat protein
LGDFNSTLRYAKRASDISRTMTDPDILALANCCVGFALLHGGDHAGARVALEAATENRPRSQKYNISYFGFDHYCLAGIHLALALSLQGYPTRAAEYARQIVENAASLNHPVTLSIALAWAVSVFLLTGDLLSAGEYADRLISRAEANSLVPYIAIGHGFKGELSICQGKAAEGVEILQRCLADLRTVRYELLITPFSIALAQGLAAVGRFAEGIALIDERIRLVETNGNLGFLPELLRVKGGIFLAMPSPDGDAAERCFIRSLELSRRQGALAWQLRSAVDLAAQQVSRGQVESARALLRPVLEQFVEGSNTPDLQAAERLLAAQG